MTIGERIKGLRNHLGLSQYAFGVKVGKVSSYISRIERGLNSPSDEMVDRICSAFDVNRSWLLDGEGEMFSESRSAYDDENMGERVKAVRKENGLLQKEFAERIHSSVDMVSRVELKKIVPSARWLQKVADEFGVSMQWLLTGEEDKKDATARSIERIDNYLRNNEIARIAVTEAIDSGDDGIWIRLEQLIMERKRMG